MHGLSPVAPSVRIPEQWVGGLLDGTEKWAGAGVLWRTFQKQMMWAEGDGLCTLRH